MLNVNSRLFLCILVLLVVSPLFDCLETNEKEGSGVANRGRNRRRSSLDEVAELHREAIKHHEHHLGNLRKPRSEKSTTVGPRKVKPTTERPSINIPLSLASNHQSPILQNDQMSEAAIVNAMIPEEPVKESAIDLLLGVLPSFDFSNTANILVLVSLVWITIYYTLKLFTTRDYSLKKSLCECQAKLFKVRQENNNLLDDLIKERENIKRFVKENSEIKNALNTNKVTVEHFEREKNNFDKRIEALENENDQQQQYIIIREKENEKLKNEIDRITKVNEELQQQVEDISIKLNQRNKLMEELRGKYKEIETLQADKVKLSDLLKEAKEKEFSLLISKEKLVKALNFIEELQSDLDKKSFQIEALKSIVDGHLNSDPDNVRCSMDELLDSIGLKAELNVVIKQLNVVKEEKNYLSTRLTELELELDKVKQDATSANKAKDGAVKELQLLESHFDKKMTEVKSELVALQLKYTEVTSKKASETELLASLERKNQEFQTQIEKFKQEQEKNDIEYKKAYCDLQNECYTLFMTEKATRRDMKAIKEQNELLRKRLSLKTQEPSNTNLQSDQFTTDSLPPPPPPLGYLNTFLDSAVWSTSSPPPPPPPPLSPPTDTWMNTTDHLASSYIYPTQHYGGSFMPRDTYSPVSHYSHDQQSEHSAFSHPSAYNYQNYGPPPPVSGYEGPLTNPTPSHWHINQQQS